MFTFDVPDNNGFVALTIRVLAPGEEYGPNGGRLDGSSQQVVEFYQRDGTDGPGQFISSYLLSAVVGHPDGMALQPDVPAMQANAQAMAWVLDTIAAATTLHSATTLFPSWRSGGTHYSAWCQGCKWQSEDTTDRQAATAAMTKHCLGTASHP